MKKGAIEFTTRQIIILILMVVIAVLIIILGIKYGDQIKNLVGTLFSSAESVV